MPCQFAPVKRSRFLEVISEISIQFHTVDLRSCTTKKVIKKARIVLYI